VQQICRRYGIPYNAGSLPRQFGTVVRKIIKLAWPSNDRTDVKPKDRELVAA
jgi:NADPH-dependent stearoyl-CoA 9-desaturase